jgi:hypothetical protein
MNFITYSSRREHNDNKNREKGFIRLQEKVESGKLSKEHINNIILSPENVIQV